MPSENLSTEREKGLKTANQSLHLTAIPLRFIAARIA